MTADALRALGVALASFAVLAIGAVLSVMLDRLDPLGVALVGASVIGIVGALDGVVTVVRGWPNKSAVAVAAVAVVLGLLGSSGGVVAAVILVIRGVVRG